MISDPSVDPELLYWCFLEWYFLNTGYGKVGCLDVDGFSFRSFVIVWCGFAWNNMVDVDDLGVLVDVLFGCWVELGFIRVVDGGRLGHVFFVRYKS